MIGIAERPAGCVVVSNPIILHDGYAFAGVVQSELRSEILTIEN